MEAKRITIALVLLSFLLGGVAGGFIGSKYFNGRPRHDRGDPSTVMQQFAERLKLDTLQSALVDSILEAHKSRFGELRKQYGESFRIHRDTLRQQINAILTPEQQERHREYIKDMEEREGRWRRDQK